jgi:PPOX class probable F420-dependent enzyme
MSETEVRAFLMHGTRTGKLAIVRRDGSPMVVPIWFSVDDDGSLLFTTWHETIKGLALRRDPRVSICVDSEDPPYAYVRVDGLAEISEDPDELRAWATRIGGRYMGADEAERFGARNGVPGELLVRVRPTRTVAEADIAG